MDRLWAPWRLSYVAGAKPPTPADPCFFCTKLTSTDDRAHLIARRREHCVVVLNRFPYNNGHLLVAPNAHKARLQELTTAEHLEIQQSLAELIDVFDRLMHPNNYNLNVNLDRVAEA